MKPLLSMLPEAAVVATVEVHAFRPPAAGDVVLYAAPELWMLEAVYRPPPGVPTLPDGYARHPALLPSSAAPVLARELVARTLSPEWEGLAAQGRPWSRRVLGVCLEPPTAHPPPLRHPPALSAWTTKVLLAGAALSFAPPPPPALQAHRGVLDDVALMLPMHTPGSTFQSAALARAEPLKTAFAAWARATVLPYPEPMPVLSVGSELMRMALWHPSLVVQHLDTAAAPRTPGSVAPTARGAALGRLLSLWADRGVVRDARDRNRVFRSLSGVDAYASTATRDAVFAVVASLLAHGERPDTHMALQAFVMTLGRTTHGRWDYQRAVPDEGLLPTDTQGVLLQITDFAQDDGHAHLDHGGRDVRQGLGVGPPAVAYEAPAFRLRSLGAVFLRVCADLSIGRVLERPGHGLDTLDLVVGRAFGL